MTMQQTDATPRGADGQAIPYEAPVTASVVLDERKGPSETPEEPDPRDVMEDAAAQRRLVQLEEQAAGNPEAEIIPRPKEDGTEEQPGEQPRDEKGRFASPEVVTPPPAPKQNGQTIRFMVDGKPQEMPADAKIVVKIEGVEQEITLGEYHKAAQIESLARRRLGEATRLKTDAERLLQTVQQPAPAQPPAPTQTSAPEAEDRDKLLADFIEAVTYARADEAKELGRKLIASPQGQTLSPEQIASIARGEWQNLNQRQRVESTLTEVRNSFKEVFADPRMQAAVAAESQRLMSEDLVALGADPRVVSNLTPDQLGHYHRQAQVRSPSDDRIRTFDTILRSAAESVHKDFIAPKISPAPKPTAIATRQDAKRAMATPPAPATARPSPKAPTVKSAAQLIAEENADRGRGR